MLFDAEVKMKSFSNK